ncbi:hypothetical protein [Butyrivibrio fibrisolvens]|uniref:hypothetical protein n=1 Tax=Butyrivibrio fibrisolvens TaxID=831 RepID=UPI0003B3B8A5|nr:hypothetical protein [Butyrivibrio fibrisolvens]
MKDMNTNKQNKYSVAYSNEWTKVNPNFFHNRYDITSPESASLLEVRNAETNVTWYVPVDIKGKESLFLLGGNLEYKSRYSAIEE